jgi:hypothetical protein
MIGHRFVNFIPGENSKSKFEQMLDIFTQLLNYTSGDASEALDWMNQLDRTHKFTDDNYGVGDFGYLGTKYTGRKPGSIEDLSKFLSKPKVAKIKTLLKEGVGVRKICRVTESSPNYVYKVKNRLMEMA